MELSAPSWVQTPRGRFALRRAGKTNDPYLVLLHGWPQSSFAWSRLVDNLAPNRQIVAPDLRGLGESTREGDAEQYQKHELAADIIAILDTLGLENFALAGHDWGGPVAQEVALARPSSVSHLILLNSPIINNATGVAAAATAIQQSEGKFQWYQYFQQAGDLPEQLIVGRERQWLSHFLRAYDGSLLDATMLDEAIRCYQIPGTVRACAGYYRTIPQDRARWASIADHVWPMPCLYLYGRHDPVVVPEFLEGRARCFADLEYREFTAGHFVTDEQPAAMAEAIDRWLDRSRSVTPRPTGSAGHASST